MPILRDKEKRKELRESLYKKMEDAGETLPEAVKALRKMLSKDQEEFAAYIGISLATLRKIEQNRGNVTIASISKILERFSLELVVKTRRKT